MPRKRKTRAAQSRANPKVPQGDEGAELEADLKQEKLKALLEDFDTEMKTFFKTIKDDLKDFEKCIEAAYMLEVNKTPKVIRDMDLEKYLGAGGKLAQDMADIENDEPSIATLTKSKKKKKKDLKPVIEDPEMETCTMKKPATRTMRKKAMSNATTSIFLPPQSTATAKRGTRQQRAQFETPSLWRGGPSAMGWETPLITPKFDPRLPVTPAMARQPKQGEVFLSLAGSPIANSKDSMVAKTEKDMRKIMVDDTEIDLDNITVPDYTEVTMNYLKELRARLNAIPLSPTNH